VSVNLSEFYPSNQAATGGDHFVVLVFGLGRAVLPEVDDFPVESGIGLPMGLLKYFTNRTWIFRWGRAILGVDAGIGAEFRDGGRDGYDGSVGSAAGG
jgi:hypothetical protein